MMTTLRQATALRLARIHNDQDSQSGFALIYSLVIIMLITTSVSSMLVVTASQIQPAQSSVNGAHATADAEAGVQAYVAWLRKNCPAAQIGQKCSAIDGLQTSINGALSSPGAFTVLPAKDTVGTGEYFALITNSSTYDTDKRIRIYSRGCSGPFTDAGSGANPRFTCVSPNFEKAIVSDIVPPAPLTSNAYYSTFETVGSSLLGQEYPARQIALPDSTVVGAANIGLTLPGQKISKVTWSGADPTDAPPPPGTPKNYNATEKACDALYYKNPRNIASGGTGRGESNSVSNSLVPGYDWSETGTTDLAGIGLGSGLTSPPHYGQCHVSMAAQYHPATDMTPYPGDLNFTGPVQSQDAFIVSGNPLLTQDSGKDLGLFSGWYGTQSPAVNSTGYLIDTPRDTTSGSGGTSAFRFNPNTAPFNVVQQVANVNLPADVTQKWPLDSTKGTGTLPNTCVYYGPTRILFNGDNTATITSPMTDAIGGSCYTSAPGGYSLQNPPVKPINPDPTKLPSGLSVVLAKVDLSAKVVSGGTTQPPTIIVRNIGARNTWAETTGSGTPNAGIPATSQGIPTDANGNALNTNANPIFDIQSGSAPAALPASTPSYAASLTSLWDNTSNLNPPCGGGGYWPPEPACTKNTQANFDAANAASNSASPSYASFTATVTGNAAQACANLTTALAAWNKNLKTSPTGPSDYRYFVSPSPCAANNGAGTTAGGTCTDATQTLTGAYTSDPLLNTSDHPGSATAKCTGTGASSTTYTVTRSSGSCGFSWGWGSPCSSWSWGNTLNQFSLKVDATAGTTYAPWVTTQAQSTFPLAMDRSIYNTMNTAGTQGPGDAYVSGALNANLSLITENDVVVTGSAPGVTTSGVTTAADLIGGHNVRVYHPIGCKSNTAIDQTSAGFCPNDTTGLFNYQTLPKPLSTNHPSAQYVNLQQDQTKPGTTCADITIHGGVFALGGPNNDGSVTNGSFTTDNPDKGLLCGNVNLNGGVFQQHRGSIGTTLEDTSGQSTGYTLSYNFDAGLSTQTMSWSPPVVKGSANAQTWSVDTTATAQPGG